MLLHFSGHSFPHLQDGKTAFLNILHNTLRQQQIVSMDIRKVYALNLLSWNSSWRCFHKDSESSSIALCWWNDLEDCRNSLFATMFINLGKLKKKIFFPDTKEQVSEKQPECGILPPTPRMRKILLQNIGKCLDYRIPQLLFSLIIYSPGICRKCKFSGIMHGVTTATSPQGLSLQQIQGPSTIPMQILTMETDTFIWSFNHCDSHAEATAVNKTGEV